MLINTGNILSLNELKLKAGQNTQEEILEALKITLRNSHNNDDTIKTINGVDSINLGTVDRDELKITAKIFIAFADPDMLDQAIEKILEIFKTDNIETLILAYGESKISAKELNELQQLWPVVEKYVNSGKLSSVGVSNVHTEVFIDLYQWSKVRPNIVQINLATCCVVPPALQAFTKENDVQLLTHNDPYQILAKDSIVELFGDTSKLQWVVKYQVHVKCRGVLSSKGYLVQLDKSNA